MDQNIEWFEEFRKSKDYQLLQQRPVAYFCAEFGLAEELPTYAGGLGVLAADVVREAADQQMPLVAVGLYYHEGYLHHELYSDGTMLKHPMRRDPEEMGFTPVLDEQKQRVKVYVPLQGRKITIVAWEMEIKGVRLFMLDTDVPENDPHDQAITNRLYTAAKETRFKQEMVLGIGGVRMLQALKIHPLLYHMNEGHSALLALEVANHEMNEYSKSFTEELGRTKQHIVFSNHTLVAAGNDMFSNDMVSALLNDYSKEVKAPVQDLVALGLVQESSIFSMTVLALRMSSRVNAVSKLHAEKAKSLWADYETQAVTNGIHIPTWDKVNFQKTQNIQSGSESGTQIVRESEPAESPSFPSVLNPENLWSKHQENKRELLKVIQEKTGQVWDEDVMLIGWARRIVGYKRPLALFQEKERLLHLLKDAKRPVRVVMAGSAHESDEEGAQMLEELQRLIVTEFDGYVVYLPNYNLRIGGLMTAGSDVWLNTPIVGFEACGTSGMKGCLNGVLPVSTKDGWVYEVDTYGIGWIVDSDKVTDSLLTTLEYQILPMYYERDANGVPAAWVENMMRARKLILDEFSGTRMLRGYIEQMYLPTMQSLQAL
jgi:starch phosphorylase